MKKVTVFETVHEHAAGIDIGAREIFVSVDGIEVVSFNTFTEDYYKCAEYIQKKNITEVAMEATGVYWMALYAMLESFGIKVCLVNPKETKQVKGRKTDVKDCRWIQKLFSAGILRESFVPEGKYMEIRQLVRERIDMIEMGSVYINKMQKCLELMNIKLKEVINQIHGVSGIKIIKAIIEGNRDEVQLLSLCDARIRKNKSQEVIKALCGNYNDTYIFMLKNNMQMWENHQKNLLEIDKEIEKILMELCKTKEIVEVKGKVKNIRHHAPKIENLHERLLQLYGVNVSRKNHQSGKMKKRVKGTSCNNAGQIFKESAQSLLNSKHIAIGSFIRRLKARKDSAIAIKAGARKLAEAYYNALTKGIDYVEQGTKKYEDQIKQREVNILRRLAKKHNMQIVGNQIAA
jgi:transposase